MTSEEIKEHLGHHYSAHLAISAPRAGWRRTSKRQLLLPDGQQVIVRNFKHAAAAQECCVIGDDADNLCVLESGKMLYAVHRGDEGISLAFASEAFFKATGSIPDCHMWAALVAAHGLDPDFEEVSENMFLVPDGWSMAQVKAHMAKIGFQDFQGLLVHP